MTQLPDAVKKVISKQELFPGEIPSKPQNAVAVSQFSDNYTPAHCQDKKLGILRWTFRLGLMPLERREPEGRPECQRLISGGACVIFKGPGFYANDNTESNAPACGRGRPCCGRNTLFDNKSCES
jgi:hypothetical protein